MIRIEKYLKTGKFGWRAQFATSNQDIMGIRIPPFAFSEHGILMLSSALKSERAVQVNIQIMRTFTKLREALLDNKDLRKELARTFHELEAFICKAFRDTAVVGYCKTLITQ
jgi:hypothetical protein